MSSKDDPSPGLTIIGKLVRTHGYRHRRRPGAEFGGDEKKFRRPRFLNDVFLGKTFHFHDKNFWWPFFSHWPWFSHFSSHFTHFPHLCCLWCPIWPFLHEKNLYFRK